MSEENRYFDDLIQARDDAQRALEVAIAKKFPIGTRVDYWCYEHSANELVVGVQGESVFVMTNDMSRPPDKRHFNMLRLTPDQQSKPTIKISAIHQVTVDLAKTMYKPDDLQEREE